MSTIARGTKASAGGGTAFVSGTSILPGEVNTDFDTVYNLVNGNLDNTNVKASADITLTKLADISGTAAEHDDTATPGTSPAASHALPTTLSGELQQLRYAIEQLGLGFTNSAGTSVQRVDGSGTVAAFWGDLPVRGPNLIKNPNFMAGSPATTTPPAGWTDMGVGTPTYSHVALAAANLSEGKGVALRIEAGSAAVEGCQQTLSGLKASTQYLVVARAKSTSGTVHLRTSGANAASSFRDINVSTAATSFTTLAGVIATDATPSNLNVRCTVQGNADTNDVQFAFVGVYECGTSFTQLGPSPWVISETDGTAGDDITATNAAETDLGVTASVYAHTGQSIEVQADIPWTRAANSGVLGFFLKENVAGGGAATVDYVEVLSDGTNNLRGRERFFFVREAPTAGSSYVYTITARTSGAGHTVTVPNAAGAAVVTGQPALKTVLRVRAVRVSQ